jgi:IS30 family transposase
MSKDVLRNKWTEEHISYLKMAYLDGTSLKTIAGKLNRSVSAVNKVLARHNLRTHSKLERMPHLNPLTNKPSSSKKVKRHQNSNRNIQSKNSIAENYRHEVSFEGVIYWLTTQQVYVEKSKNDVYYELQGRPMTKQQILYHANLLREQLHLPIFWVQDVTYS